MMEKKKNRKKIDKRIAVPLIILLVLGCAFGGARAIRSATAKAYVVPVEILNMPYYADPMSMDGMVYDTESQNVYISATQVINSVCVSEGQRVSAGDKLLDMDITSEEITLKMMEIQVLRAQNDLENARAELNKLRNTKPVQKKKGDSDQKEKEDPGERAKIGDAWNYLDGTAVKDFLPRDAGNTAPYGSLENPVRYLLSKDGLLYGSFLNALKKEYQNTYVVIEVREGDLASGQLYASWTLYTGELADVSDEDSWSVATGKVPMPEGTSPIQRGGWVDPDGNKGGSGGKGESGGSGGSGSEEQEYTAEELAQAIRQAEINVRSCDIALRRAQLEYQRQKDQTGDGGIYAKTDGVVTKVGDPDKPPQDGSPFLTVAAGQGVFVKGNVSELALDKVKPGQEITATSWETGMTYTGTIRSVDEYPASDAGYYGGNPNVSYYSFQAELQDAQDLSTGMYLQLSADVSGDDTGSIYLMSAFIRSDAGGKYVMADEDGRLVKRYVRCGKTYYGEITEVKEGITTDDLITLPYGAGAVQGTRTEEAESEEVFWQ